MNVLGQDFERPQARVMSGTDILAELPLLMAAHDAANGLKTGGYVSGYRGSPLAQFDMVLEQRAEAFSAARIVAKPGLNEDLAATAVWGTQQTGLFPDTMTVEGIFAMWYGKGPGVDRTLDVFRHANAAGTDPKGGVLTLMGDDHAAVSSTLPHQTEHDMIAAMMPVLSAAGVHDYVRMGLMGWHMSRASGAWVGFKCQTEIVESSASVLLEPPLEAILRPPEAGTLGLRAGDTPSAQEARLFRKLAVAQDFARLNGLDHERGCVGKAGLGVIASGKAWLDVLEALRLLGVDDTVAEQAGLALRQIGLVWPLEPDGLKTFASRCDRLLFVEEKRGLIEDQARTILYNMPADDRPQIAGKCDFQGQPLLPAQGVIGPMDVARAIIDALPERAHRHLRPLPDRAEEGIAAPALSREPYFCAGCPHATSTRLPDGSRATTGIGCHMMMIDTPGRQTTTFTQMGGEGASWLGLSPFSTERHLFVNMGDGTYEHSGILAIRAAIAAGVNATYKILFNDAVAMTGGQAHDGPLTVPRIAAQMLAEGAVRVAVVAENPEHLSGTLPSGVTLDHRDQLEAVQHELRQINGISVIVYDQVCAAEKRRRRKTGEMEKPTVRAFINEAVCEGCGDCGVQSGCIALEPVETVWGPKRRIDQSACNVDLSCLKGFCPSFVTIEGAEPATPEPSARLPEMHDLPEPAVPAAGQSSNIVLAGIGGTGVIAIGKVLARAAEVDGLAAQILDQTGLSQKNGAVVSHVRLANSEASLHSPRIPPASADTVLAFDAVVANSPKVAPLISRDRTRIVVDDHVRQNGQIARTGGRSPDKSTVLTALTAGVEPDSTHVLTATEAALQLTGDTIAANTIVLGHAWQRGLIPLSHAAMKSAIGAGRAGKANLDAFALGRLSAAQPDAFSAALSRKAGTHETIDDLIKRGTRHMAAWQNGKIADRWRAMVEAAHTAEKAIGSSEAFTRAIANTGLRLMAYKDEYEVARLYRDPAFTEMLGKALHGGKRKRVHLAPPMLPLGRDGRTGRPRKIALGRSADLAFALLPRLKWLRGTPLDPFGYTAERRTERRLSRDFFDLACQLTHDLTPKTHAKSVEIAELGQMVRGFGPVKEAAIARYEAALAEKLQK